MRYKNLSKMVSMKIMKIFKVYSYPRKKLSDILPTYLGSVINYGAKMVNVGCSSSQYMVVQSANYGDFNKNGVFNDDKSVATVCSAVTTCRMKSRCNGNKSCDLTIDNSLMPSQHCLNKSKEVYMKYTCDDTNNSSLSTEGNSCYN